MSKPTELQTLLQEILIGLEEIRTDLAVVGLTLDSASNDLCVAEERLRGITEYIEDKYITKEVVNAE